MKNKFLFLMAILSFLLMLTPVGAQADQISYNFVNITNNYADIGSQFKATAYDRTEAATAWSQTILVNEVLFVFKNLVGTASDIHEIYFDLDGASLVSQTKLINNLTSDSVNYHTNLDPADLPSGGNVGFVANVGFGADSQGAGHDYLSNPNEALGIVIKVAAGSTDLADTLQGLRIGLHVGGLPTGASDSYVNQIINNPVPEPATMLLLGSGLVGLAGFGKRKFAKKG